MEPSIRVRFPIVAPFLFYAKELFDLAESKKPKVKKEKIKTLAQRAKELRTRTAITIKQLEKLCRKNKASEWDDEHAHALLRASVVWHGVNNIIERTKLPDYLRFPKQITNCNTIVHNDYMYEGNEDGAPNQRRLANDGLRGEEEHRPFDPF